MLRSRKRPWSTVVTNNDPHSNGKGKDVNIDEVPVGKDEEDTAFLQASADMFGELVDDLGPPLKALSVRRASYYALRNADIVLAVDLHIYPQATS